MPWHVYVLDFVAGLFLANGVPHFVQGISGNPFPSPFASPPGVGESSPLVNVLWGWVNVAIELILLWFFLPTGSDAALGYILIGLGGLAMAIMLARHFGKVRARPIHR